MSNEQSESRWQRIGLWVVKGLLAAAFVAAGGAKLAGVPMLVTEFEHIGLGQWFRYLTGTLEVIGAVTILIPAATAFGGLLLSCIMVGATFTHLFVIGGSPLPVLLLLALAFVVAYAHRDQLRPVLGAGGTQAA
jgi:hypothetical protein